MISKWTVLVLACFVTFGMYYSFDTPSVLHEQLYHHFKKKNEPLDSFEFDFSLMYSVYSLPNTFLPLIGGLLVDKFGNNRIMFIFGLFVLVGNFIQTYACVTKNMSVYIFGRFIFGFGAETLGVCGNTIVSRWFRGSELAFALAINLSFCKLAGVMNDWISPVVEEHFGINDTSYTVSLVCLACFILTIILIVSLPKDEELDALNGESHSEHIELGHTSYYQTASADDPEGSEITHNDVQEIQEYLSVTSKNADKELIRHSITTKTKTPHGEFINEESVIEYHRRTSETSSSVHSDKPQGCMREFCSTMCQLNAGVWILFVFTFLMYGVFVPFNNISNPIMIEFFFASTTDPAQVQKDLVYAAQLQSIPYFLSVIINPILGLSIDWLGRRTALFTFSAMVLISGHTCIYLGYGPILPLMLLGVAYSTYATVIWACVPVVVKDELTGTAFGLMAAFQNTSQFVVPLILQHLFSLSHGYATSELFFVGMATAGLILSLLLWYLDERYYNAVLRRPTITTDPVSPTSVTVTDYSPLDTRDMTTDHNPQQAHYQAHSVEEAETGRGHFLAPTSNFSMGVGGGIQFQTLSRNNSMAEPRSRRVSDAFILSHRPFSTVTSTPSPGLLSDASSSPEPVITKVPVRIVPIPRQIPASFSVRSPFRASLAGHFPTSDNSELLKQVTEKNRMVAPPVAHSMMAPNSYAVMKANGGVNKVAIPFYFSDSRESSPVAMPTEQQYLVPKKMTKSQSFHSYGARI